MTCLTCLQCCNSGNVVAEGVGFDLSIPTLRPPRALRIQVELYPSTAIRYLAGPTRLVLRRARRSSASGGRIRLRHFDWLGRSRVLERVLPYVNLRARCYGGDRFWARGLGGLCAGRSSRGSRRAAGKSKEQRHGLSEGQRRSKIRRD